MRLRFMAFDGRQFNYLPVIDEDTGNEVGIIKSNGTSPHAGGGINVWLFDGKY